MEHPKDFPSVKLNGIKYLPEYPGIYFVLRDSEVLYIGQSQNIRQRWTKHHKMPELQQIENIKIHFIPSDGRDLFEQEAEWIGAFTPSLNTAGVRRFQYKPLSQSIINNVVGVSLTYAVTASYLAYKGLGEGNLDVYILAVILLVVSASYCLGGWVVWKRVQKEQGNK